MIEIKNTENLTGVTISGDFNDLYNLVEAFHLITIDEFSARHHRHIGISMRVLGVCYDIRHAYQGDREIELIDNQMTEDKMKWRSIITPKNNVYYRCHCLYPEMFFVMLALNELVQLRIKDLSRTKYILKEALDKRVIWDDTIATIRFFQAQFTKCVKETFTEAAFARWLTVMNSDYLCIEEITTQFIDVVNIDYINLTKEKRLKSLSSIAKRIADFRHDKEHNQIKDVVTKAAREYQCDPGLIRLKGIEYPEDFEW
ncbi:DUF6904 family protein [Heliophilum fasciatum]|uniref:Uncharacterized protein n=1 Tax=Heliophilum fasciatum TaxID=35700 RepID=A0A4R2RLB0_9FIRM|nr:hypothetical protein [Heliophilum fasciatum]MCW2278377.1 hypothetical protein [Heliophilum fasciatum]TCP63724.1 hypothetical protein EDD73_11668 [Heliophilum fasciatum]